MMLRNKEVLIYFSFLGIVLVVGVVIAIFLASLSVWIVFGTGLVIIAASYFYTSWRYREIAKLSSYLQQISHGDYTLDVRDNREGELSILKNNIYKVTTMLSEHHADVQADKEKLTEAISDISHQLKTPLTSMLMMADFLQAETITPEKRREFAGHIQAQLERIEWLVSTLLKLSKIDAGSIQFKKEPVVIATLIDHALDPFRIPIEVKNLNVIIDGDVTATFQGDANWTREAFINLIKNAVEYTPVGGEMYIHYAENSLYTEVEIENSGTGIAKEDVPYIFQRFYKGKNMTENSVGIGLAMTQAIIAQQMGTIEVQSNPDENVLFRVRFFKKVI